MDAEELLLETARRMLIEGPPERLAAELADAGLEEEVRGDSGPLFELQGRLTAVSTLLDLVVVPDRPGVRLVLPPPSASSPPGRGRGGDVEVDGVVPAGGVCRSTYAVGREDGAVLLVEGLTATPVAGFDPDLGITRVTGRAPATATLGVSWAAVEEASCRAFAWELIGLAENALTIAVDHVRNRRQFGRPIAEFQTVRHRLSDVRTSLTAARETLLATAARPAATPAAVGSATPSPTEPGTTGVAALAGKALAGRAALSAVRVAQQVCGAMGFTWEHPLHRVVRRVHLVDSMFGGAEVLPLRIGELLLAGGAVPRLAPLSSPANDYYD